MPALWRTAMTTPTVPLRSISAFAPQVVLEVVVAGAHHPVADLEGASAISSGVPASWPAAAARRPGKAVQCVDGRTRRGHQEAVVAGGVVGPPAVDGGGEHPGRVAAQGHSAVAEIEVEGVGGVAVAQVGDRLFFPRRVLAAVQLQAHPAVGGGHRAANPPPASTSGSWRWSPTRITRAPAVRAMVSRYHRRWTPSGFVDYQDVARTERFALVGKEWEAIVRAGMPAPRRSSRAAAALGAAPRTRQPTVSSTSRTRRA